MQLRHAVLAVALAAFAGPGPAFAQGGDTPGAQAQLDQQVDSALDTLHTPGVPHALTQLEPPTLPGTRGPLRFEQEPPAAQNDFSEVTGPVCPRRGNC